MALKLFKFFLIATTLVGVFYRLIEDLSAWTNFFK
jgi:hypothetical protein